MKIWTSVLNTFWRDHISDKYGLRGDMSPYVRRLRAHLCQKSTFSFAMTVMDKVEGWNEEDVGGGRTSLRACGSTPKPCCVMGAGVTHHSIYSLDLVIIVESVSWVIEDFLWGA